MSRLADIYLMPCVKAGGYDGAYGWRVVGRSEGGEEWTGKEPLMINMDTQPKNIPLHLLKQYK